MFLARPICRRGAAIALLVWMTWLWPNLLGMKQVVEPATIPRPQADRAAAD